MTPSWLLFAFGTLGGLVYWGLGLAASSHFKDEQLAAGDRFLSTGMLWSLSSRRYTDRGQRLCAIGNVALAVAAVCWLGFGFAR